MMIDYENEITDTDYETDTNCCDYCTNPMAKQEEEIKYFWLDDLGWI